MEVLRVAASSSPNKLAGALANLLKKEREVQIKAIGAGAVNQGIKAVAIARGFVGANGIELYCVPAFMDMEIDGEKITGIKIIVKSRRR